MGGIADDAGFAETSIGYVPVTARRGGIRYPERTMVEYPGQGSGHAGNDTSRERQEREDATGITAEMQQIVFTWLHVRGAIGCTAAEVEDHFLVGHGRASSALSHLHRAGHIRRIKERRQRHEVYVLPEHVGGREESPYRPRVTVPSEKKIRALMKHLDSWESQGHTTVGIDFLRRHFKEDS